MRVVHLLRAVLLPTLCLADLVAPAGDSQVQSVVPAVVMPTSVEGDWRVDCPPDISVCGKITNVEVVRRHNSTIYVTQNHTKTTTTTMDPHTRVITSITVVTVKNQTEGLCRDTSTIYDPAPLTVTVDVNITTTREFVPIVNSTTVVVSTVTAAALQQCFINLPPIGAFPPSVTAAPNVTAATTSIAQSNDEQGSTARPPAMSGSSRDAEDDDDENAENERNSQDTSNINAQNPLSLG